MKRTEEENVDDYLLKVRILPFKFLKTLNLTDFSSQNELDHFIRTATLDEKMAIMKRSNIRWVVFFLICLILGMTIRT